MWWLGCGILHAEAQRGRGVVGDGLSVVVRVWYIARRGAETQRGVGDGLSGLVRVCWLGCGMLHAETQRGVGDGLSVVVRVWYVARRGAETQRGVGGG